MSPLKKIKVEKTSKNWYPKTVSKNCELSSSEFKLEGRQDWNWKFIEERKFLEKNLGLKSSDQYENEIFILGYKHKLQEMYNDLSFKCIDDKGRGTIFI